MEVLEDRFLPGDTILGNLFFGTRPVSPWAAADTLATPRTRIPPGPTATLGVPSARPMAAAAASTWRTAPAAPPSPGARGSTPVAATPDGSHPRTVATATLDPPLVSAVVGDPLAASDPFAATAAVHAAPPPIRGHGGAVASAPVPATDAAPAPPTRPAITPADSPVPNPAANGEAHPIPLLSLGATGADPRNDGNHPPAVTWRFPTVAPDASYICSDPCAAGQLGDPLLATLDRGNSPVRSVLSSYGGSANLLQENFGALPGNPSLFSEAPVRFADGAVKLPQTDLASAGFGSPWGLTRSWSNVYPAPTFTVGANNNVAIFGNNVIVPQLPCLVSQDPTQTDRKAIAEVGSGFQALLYTPGPEGSHYFNPQVPFVKDQLAHLHSGYGAFQMTDSHGGVLLFNDVDGTVPSNMQGLLYSFTDPQGNVTTVLHSSDPTNPVPTGFLRTDANNSNWAERYRFDYNAAGQVSQVTLERQSVLNGPWSTVRYVAYTYYDGTQNYGTRGDLMAAKVHDADGTLVDVSYYRYYTGGYLGGLKYVFDPASFARLSAAYGDPTVNDLGDTVVAPFATNFFQYDAVHRVSQEVAQGFGSSAAPASGLGTFTFSYSSRAGQGLGLDPFNTWKYRTVETLPDYGQKVYYYFHSSYIVYSNTYGQVMLKAYQTWTDQGTSTTPPPFPISQWETYYHYDSTGSVDATVNPTAITPGTVQVNGTTCQGYNEATLNLVSQSGSDDYWLSPSTGLVEKTDYTSVGSVEYFHDQRLQQGWTAPSSILVRAVTYVANAPLPVVATDRQYLTDDANTYAETDYGYDWYPGTSQIQDATIVYPAVAVGQNAPGDSDSAKVFFDKDQRVTQTVIGLSTSGGGVTTTYQRDEGTGAVTQMVQDAGNGGLQLTTTWVVDPLGRPIREIDPLYASTPAASSTYMVYDDVNHAVRTYRGWVIPGGGGTPHPTGPVEVVRADRSHSPSYTEALTMAPPITGDDINPDGSPKGNEPISNVLSLSRTFTSQGGQVIEQDDYVNLGANLYTTAPYIGQAGTTYYATYYGYSSTGQRNRVQSPPGPLGQQTQPGTIDRTVYDVLDRAASTWVGTNDAGATDSDPSNGGQAPNNMVQVSLNTYDGYTLNGVTVSSFGDSLLTQQTVSPGGSATPRTSQFVYDWRDRLVAAKDGELPNSASENDGTHRPIYVASYDTQDEVTMVQQYDGDTVTIADLGDNFTAPPAALRRAQSATGYDAQGRVYQTSVSSVDPSSGAVGPALVSNTWYDRRGNPIKVSQPGGLVTKAVYDGADRPVTVYTTDGAGDQTWADAASVTSNYVLQQVDTTYDANSNPILVTTRDRFDSETHTGALWTPTSSLGNRTSYVASYYDAADRLKDVADFGTNGGASFSRPAQVPLRSDQVLVSSTSYQLDAVQTVALSGGPTGGTFTLTFNGQTTDPVQHPLSPSATAAAVQSALAALSSVNGNVSVTGPAGGPWVVQFTGPLGEQVIPPMTGNGSGLTGGTNPAVFVGATDTGRVQKATDPRGLIAKADYDLLGRTVQTVANVTDGVPHAAENSTTQYAYDGDDHVVLLTAVQPGGGVQQTQYNYGYSTSVISSNDLLASVQYPDQTTGLPSTHAADQESFQYDAVEETQHTDRSGNVHAFSYDVLSRPTSDAVQTLGTGVDPTVQRLDTAYNTQGLASLFTGYSTPAGGSANIVNQVQDTFNGLGQLTTETQVHGNPNNPNPPQGTVGYAYDQTTDGTGQSYVHGSRLVQMTYPNNRKLDFVYNTTTTNPPDYAGLDGRISRLSALADDLNGTPSTTLEAYSYLGLGTVVQRAHPEANLTLSYLNQPGGSTDGGDQYTGLDRFGRVIDQYWAVGSTTTDRFQYGYDRDGNVLYKNNAVNGNFSELYHVNGAGNGYDGLNQLLSFSRGTLNSTHDSITGTPSRSQSWTLDAMGNWTSVTSATNGNATTQNRSHNAQNQITQINGLSGPTYDSNGNLTTDETGQQYAYDAWNRVVAVKAPASQGGATRETYAYDALGRRILENVVGVAGRDLYYNSAWQVLEERENSNALVRAQQVWDPLASDTLVLRDRDVGGTGTLGERLYVQQDAHGDVTAVVDGKSGSPTLGQVQERYVEDPYGSPTFLTASWQVNGSGNGASAVNWVYLHQGGRDDPMSGLYNFRHRDYSPTLGRWLENDPLGYAGGDTNLYRDVANDPTNGTDPSGLHYESSPYLVGIFLPDPEERAQLAARARDLDNLHASLLPQIKRLQGVPGTAENWQAFMDLYDRINQVRNERANIQSRLDLPTTPDGIKNYKPCAPALPEGYNDDLWQYAPAMPPTPPRPVGEDSTHAGISALPPGSFGMQNAPPRDWVFEFQYDLIGPGGVFDHLAGVGGVAFGSGGPTAQARSAPARTGAKTGPKTDPTAPHNATIRAEAARLEAEGNTILNGGGKAKEAVIRTPGGFKEARRPDILYQTPSGELRGVNVGRVKADGSPVPREVKALADLNGPGGLPTIFIPYFP